MQIDVLDWGFVRFIEAWGTGVQGVPAGDEDLPDHTENWDFEVGIIEAARQSTQGSFRGWNPASCDCFNDTGSSERNVLADQNVPSSMWHLPTCGSRLNPGDKKLLSFLYDNKHATPFEFSGMVLEIRAPIFVFREWHRHRTQSYNEASARYAPLEAFDYMPEAYTVHRRAVEAATTRNRQASGSGRIPTVQEVDAWLLKREVAYRTFEDEYQEALRIGIPKELARIGMPVGRHSQMRASANLRNWLAFLTLRMDPNAQFEIREYANAVAEIVKVYFPHTYERFVRDRGYGSAAKAKD